MAEDRSKQKLVIYKNGTKISEGDMGTKFSDIVGIAAGTEVAAGEYQAAYSDGMTESEKTDVPAFKVNEANVPVVGVIMSQQTGTMKVGDTKSITGTVTPDNATNKSVSYSSSDTAIASVDSKGLITAIAEGSADIIATSTDGGFTGKASLTVNAAV
ncbi:FHA domain-containing regulator [Weissella oryzae SG25]|uniref:FHA domain-containing regulator n=1 Tax=Weissella oryzae (strain DSM 25784 / JCM 18191 / LMG 30913 / SG25) TaxID=1329250 RepID=A0A069CT74_WEIOS|nr:Ig-like domain-containing protein [Weissella oryzae]GAK31010.1 FHA domain-containing regulator [Weissella oryzae SG25]